MIKLILFDSTNTLLNLFPNGDSSLCVIVPDPNAADFYRSEFAKRNKQIEVISIAHFVKAELQWVEADGKILRKSELLYYLATAFKKSWPQGEYQDFIRCFNIVTEFRSYSLDLTILNSILEHFDEDTKTTVLYFHQVLEMLNLKDEHKAYNQVSHFLRHQELPLEYPEKRTIVFMGFKFLTSQQIDLLMSLKIRNDIWIPFPESVYEKSFESDWIKYLEFDHKEILKDETKEKFNNEMIIFPEGRMIDCLQTLDIENGKLDIVLAKEKLELEDTRSIPFNLKYKVQHSILDNSIEFLFSHLRNQLLIQNHSITLETLQNEIERLKKEFIHLKQFKNYAGLAIIEKSVKNWQALTDDIQSIGIFHLELIKEVCLLDRPRNYYTVDHAQDGKLLSLKELNEVQDHHKLIVIATGLFGELGTFEQNYDEKLEKFLKSIGPVRRSELDTLLTQFRLKEVFQSHQSILLIENNLLNHSVHWSHFTKDLFIENDHVHNASLKIKEQKKMIFRTRDHDLFNSLSATEFQTYLDCPRKYFLQYIDKLQLKTSLEHTLDQAEIGTLAHKVIEVFVTQYSVFNEVEWNKTISHILKEFILKNKKKIKDEQFASYLLKLDTLAKDVSILLIDIKKQLQLQFEFEYKLKPIENIPYKGSIDCVSITENQIILFDFKTSITKFSFEKILNFEFIQLWFYLWYLSKIIPDFARKEIFFGYLSLNKLDKKLLTNSDKKELVSDLKFKKCEVDFSIFHEKLEQLWKSIKDDKDYLPKPRDPNVCDFCFYKDICPKGVI